MFADMRRKAVVYWVYDESCSSPKIHGYIGATVDLKDREFRHRKRFGYSVKIKVLFQGTVKQCLNYEKILRPNPSIGWNEFGGGEYGWKQSKLSSKKKSIKLKGRLFSDEHKKKLASRVFTKKWRTNLRKSQLASWARGARKDGWITRRKNLGLVT